MELIVCGALLWVVVGLVEWRWKLCNTVESVLVVVCLGVMFVFCLEKIVRVDFRAGAWFGGRCVVKVVGVR